MASNPKQPYGDVTYADPGYQSDKKKRYPIDTAEHVRAAWSYINKANNASQYSSDQLASIKGRIKAAAKKFGIEISDDSSSRALDLSSYDPELGFVQRSDDADAELASLVSSGLYGSPYITRSFPLEDISVSGGDGRTVTAYAAVFNVEAEIRDHEGHYNEVIDPLAFTTQLQRSKVGNSWRVGVFYNHGLTLHGTPSERGSMPLGVPLEIRSDNRGLLTVTRYNKTQQADEVLESINNGDITGQSFTGAIRRSDPTLTRGQRRAGGYRKQNGQLTTVRRMELGLDEYGPTPIPAYEAEILGVRYRQRGYVLPDELKLSEDQGVPDESAPVEAGEDREVSTSGRSLRRQRLIAANRARGISPHAQAPQSAGD